MTQQVESVSSITGADYQSLGYQDVVPLSRAQIVILTVCDDKLSSVTGFILLVLVDQTHKHAPAFLQTTND